MIDGTKVSKNNICNDNVDMYVAFEEIYNNLRETTKQFLEERSRVEIL